MLNSSILHLSIVTVATVLILYISAGAVLRNIEMQCGYHFRDHSFWIECPKDLGL